MNARFGVVSVLARSAARCGSGTTLRSQDPLSIREWKYTNGLCRAAYWSFAAADWVPSGMPVPKLAVGTPHRSGSRVRSLPALSSWSAKVGTLGGKTQPAPTAWPSVAKTAGLGAKPT
jgi:hypothetical protein